MANFYYYFPGGSPVTKDRIKTAGAGHLLGEGISPAFRGLSVGPDDKAGQVAVLALDSAVWTGLHADTVWQHCGDYWIGYDPKSPPLPSDLERRNMLAESIPVELEDGNMWDIPVARRASGRTGLPRVARWDHAKGFYFGDVVDRYQDFFRGAMLAFDAIVIGARGEENADFKVSIELDLYTHALNANYRVGPAEIGMLGLITSTNRRSIVYAIIDMEGLIAILKKKMQAAQKRSKSPSSTPGEKGSSPATSQQSASCI